MKPALIINPVSDHEFVALVRAQTSEASDAADLQARLRVSFPRSVVRKRELSGETTSMWYVYRDGSWTSGEPSPEGAL